MDDIFLILTVFNTEMGLKNVERNKQQLEQQKRIEEKLDKILAILSEQKS